MTPRPEPPDFPASQLFLRRLAFSLVRDEARAEDLVQDTWATWVERRPSGLAEPRAWLARVLRNRAFNLKRSERRRAEREELAGRPDPTMPETDGTLEAQAQLLEALRHLDEPYRSTLVERYYHDLSPSAIAGRSGTPLDTVKARLKRGLEKLRAEMDRRYGGDRGAWCHWLALPGAPLVPIPSPSGSGGAAPFAGMGGGGMPLVGWLALGGLLAVGAVLRSEWTREPEVEQESAGERRTSVPVSETIVGGTRGRVPVEQEDPAPRAEHPAKRPLGQPALQAPPAAPEALVGYSGPAGRETFDWPQYGGGADHDNYREREDEIYAPEVLWFMPGCAGQPTLEGGDLYTGGLTAMRLDPESGRPTGVALGLFSGGIEGLVQAASKVGDHEGLATFQRLLESGEGGSTESSQIDFNDESLHMVAPAPVVTAKLVLARRTWDGGVTALDRGLVNEAWSWDSGSRGEDPSRVPLCLASDELVLVATHARVVALRVADGKEAWRFDANGRIRMVPASDGQRVFFGTDRGQFNALDLETGAEIWRTHADCFGATAPVVVGKRVFVPDLGGLERWDLDDLDAVGDLANVPSSLRPPRLHAFDVKAGKVLWRSPLEGFLVSLALGPGRKSLVAGHGDVVDRFDLTSGKREDSERLEAKARPVTTPALVGESLILGDLDGSLRVHDLRSGELRWTFRAHAPGRRVKVLDFVHSGTRIYVATSIGLFCIGDVEEAPPAPGFLLSWSGDPHEPSYADEDEEREK